MRSRSNLIQQYIIKMLDEPKFAWAFAISLSCFDFTAWIAMSFVMLVILRVGLKASFNLMCASFVVSGLSAYYHENSLDAWINVFLNCWPGYLSAIVLYYSRSWFWVAYVWVAFAFMSATLIANFMPEFSLHQLQNILQTANHLSSELPIPLTLLKKLVFQYQDLATHLILGVLMLSAVFNASMGLTMARSLQSQIYYPEGFHKEMLNLRGCRWLILLLALAMLLVWKLNYLFPLYMIPTLLFYFFVVGLSVGVSSLAKNRIQVVFGILILASVFMPYVFLPLFVGIGALDSFLNFRVLLSKKVKPFV
jgi:hypothetical protein